MAPIKGPKKALKSMEKPIERPVFKSKTKKRNYQGFSIYIYKILKTVAKENLGISKKSMLIMNNFVSDMFEKIAVEAGRLVAHGKKTTMSSREIQTAIKLIVPGELAAHANIEAMKAISMYHKSVERDSANKN